MHVMLFWMQGRQISMHFAQNEISGSSLSSFLVFFWSKKLTLLEMPAPTSATTTLLDA